MALEVKVPVLPESVSDATIATWHKKAGDAVKRDENLVDLETDKVVLEVPSPVDGVLKEIKFETGAPSPASSSSRSSRKAPSPLPRQPRSEGSPRSPEGRTRCPAPQRTPPLRPAYPAPACSPAGRFVADHRTSVDPADVSGTGRRGRSPRKTWSTCAPAARPPGVRRARPKSACR
jgi:2-oxoglutarate dehydrogenase E2 component (dihydrolipoamide succinyltransferase)